MNNCIFIGNIVRDPVLKHTSDKGVPVCTFTLAVERNYTGQDGKKLTDFLPIVCWRDFATSTANNLSKGRKIAVRALAQTRKYTDKNGEDRYITEFVADEIKYLDYPKNSVPGEGSFHVADDYDSKEFEGTPLV